MAFLSNLRQLGVRQNSRPELVVLAVTQASIVNGTNAGITEGSNQAIVTKNGTGDYTFTLNRVARRNIQVIGASASVVDLRYSATVTSSTVRIVWELNGTDTNTNFSVSLFVPYCKLDR